MEIHADTTSSTKHNLKTSRAMLERRKFWYLKFEETRGKISSMFCKITSPSDVGTLNLFISLFNLFGISIVPNFILLLL